MASNVPVKQEPTDATDLENRIIELCRSDPKGIGDAIIQEDMPHIDVRQRATAINRLLSAGRIDLLKTTAGLVYKLKDPQTSSKMKGSDNQEKLIYQIIEEAGNKGIWIRDIRYKSNLLMTQVSKILRNLESKKLIKAIKSVGASKKKVYMLYNIDPDRSVTGGAWYSDQDFESEFVEVLNQQCMKFLHQTRVNAENSKHDPITKRNASYASSNEVWKFISELGISKVQLSVEDIETILNTLIYDNKVEVTVVASVESGQIKLYRSIELLIEPTGLMRTACGVCPVFNECQEGGTISPTTCIYMKEWLDY
ncbi:DNA-directed RNA polymerase III subunit RPC6-like [Saccoglossus kowalevskii]|uniref:DNA-directed RNA polymerase III subunit RPC6 n=1 Tax=Saccoglossus kowalevskii TaxID=10224 RepID=A0ABM0GJJ6_SACKO|nr:PREDICTED: DNA-directed RNA polymerase III subunit RPC6-like [Saccoglossus kowalevskii]